MLSINSKMPNVGTTIFTVMNQLAQQYNAVNLGQGFPDYEMDRTLIDLVNKAMLDGINQYVHMAGLLSLRACEWRIQWVLARAKRSAPFASPCPRNTPAQSVKNALI